MQETLKQTIFRIITTQWRGSTMLFPSGGRNNIIIKDKDILDLIDKAIERANRPTN